MLKMCPLCGTEKSLSDFGVNNSKRACKGGVQSYCKPCGKLNSQLRLHSMTKDQYLKLLQNQDYCCLICGDPFDMNDTRNIHIDHDHNCCPTVQSCGRCTRGILCGGCNKMLGFGRENIDIFLAAAKYISSFKDGD